MKTNDKFINYKFSYLKHQFKTKCKKKSSGGRCLAKVNLKKCHFGLWLMILKMGTKKSFLQC